MQLSLGDPAEDCVIVSYRGRKGYAVVAARAAPAGTVMCGFEGPIVALGDIPPGEINHAILIDDHRWMIPLAPGRYINHGCDPNCALRDRPGDPDRCDVVTVRAVAAGEELSFSYNRIDAAEYAANRDNPSYAWNPAWSFDCACGAANCRGRIDGYELTGPAAPSPTSKEDRGM